VLACAIVFVVFTSSAEREIMVDYSERSRTSYNNKADGYDDSREAQFTRRIHQMLLPVLDLRADQNVFGVVLL